MTDVCKYSNIITEGYVEHSVIDLLNPGNIPVLIFTVPLD